MAEHNLFLGTANKSVGDVTLYRRNGKQVSRVRVRNVANPRSEAQSITRNYLAPVIKFYAQLSDVLARSFEGLNKSRSYNEFQRVNIALARKEEWFLPKGEAFYPLPYLLSRGSIAPLVYDISEDLGEPALMIESSVSLMNNPTFGYISQAFIKMGYKVGDVVTAIAVIDYYDGTYAPASLQFTVNPNDAAPAYNVGTTGIGFVCERNSLYISNGTYGIAAGAVIVSRWHRRKWLRSTQRLACAADIIANLQSAASRAASIESYSRGGSYDDGSVYPGGDGQAYSVATMSGRSLLFYGGQYAPKVVTSNNGNFILLKPANVDTYFYILYTDRGYLGTNSNKSTAPADWRCLDITPQGVSAENTIPLAPDTDFYKYLVSIGYLGN